MGGIAPDGNVNRATKTNPLAAQMFLCIVVKVCFKACFMNQNAAKIGALVSVVGDPGLGGEPRRRTNGGPAIASSVDRS